MHRLVLPLRPTSARRPQMCSICSILSTRHSFATLSTAATVAGAAGTCYRAPARSSKSRDLNSHSPATFPRGINSSRFTTTSTYRFRTTTSLSGIGSHGQRQNLPSRWATNDDQDGNRGNRSTKTEGGLTLDKVIAPVLHFKSLFLSHTGIPTEELVMSVLRACERASGLLKNSIRPPQHANLVESKPAPSVSEALLSFDGSSSSDVMAGSRSKGDAGLGTATEPTSALTARRLPQTPGHSPSPDSARADSAGDFARQHKRAMDTIWDAAYAIIAHPNAPISREVLSQYIRVQARLGRPETLPHVLSMYASKPVPQKSSTEGSIKYVKQNPHMPARAVDPDIAEAALDVAIEAKNLDAAVGIIESTYSTKAFTRSKLLQKAFLPASCLASLPVVIYVLASKMSTLQNTMDGSKATTIAFAGIITYIGFTGIIGMIATATGNDQMKRVTWTPGTSMYQRWAREEERAALDKVACSFGFSQPSRWGEEEGEEFAALREYVMRKGMMLDRVELIEGFGA
ncbi:hypothetical protein MCOR25_008522 [Pyricularia grisea]|nr:hypothetical protein MCOR25_008522 [Pyricularia grisea]